MQRRKFQFLASAAACVAAAIAGTTASAQSLPGNQPNNGGPYTYVVLSAAATLGGSNTGGTWYLSTPSGRTTVSGAQLNAATGTGASWTVFAALYGVGGPGSPLVLTTGTCNMSIGVYGPVMSGVQSYGVNVTVGAAATLQANAGGRNNGGSATVIAQGPQVGQLTSSWPPGQDQQTTPNSSDVIIVPCTLYPVQGENYFYGTVPIDNLETIAELQTNLDSGDVFSGDSEVQYTDRPVTITGPSGTSTFNMP